MVFRNCRHKRIWEGRSYTLKKEIYISKEIFIYKGMSLSTPGREGWSKSQHNLTQGKETHMNLHHNLTLVYCALPTDLPEPPPSTHHCLGIWWLRPFRELLIGSHPNIHDILLINLFVLLLLMCLLFWGRKGCLSQKPRGLEGKLITPSMLLNPSVCLNTQDIFQYISSWFLD